jgi:hypothetical protein
VLIVRSPPEISTKIAQGKLPEAYDLSNQRAAMVALGEERSRRGLQVLDMEMKSGVSMNTFYAWSNGNRSPTLGNLVALAQTLGFRIVMVREPGK